MRKGNKVRRVSAGGLIQSFLVDLASRPDRLLEYFGPGRGDGICSDAFTYCLEDSFFFSVLFR